MASSRPIISKPMLTDGRSSSQGVHLDSQIPQDRASSRRSSTSSKTSKTQRRSSSQQSQNVSRGRKPYEVSEEVAQGLVKLVDSTDESFDTIAKAVEEVGGPRKLWLRKRFEQISGTKSFSLLRLRNHRPSAEDRKRRQLLAKESADQHLPSNGDLSSPHSQNASQRWSISRFSTISETNGHHGKRFSGLSTAASLPRASSSQEHRWSHRQSWDTNASAPMKRTLEEGREASEYVAKGNRTRALSISSITRRLENLTGNTGFYEHIQRTSVKSHISPVFKSFRWSKGSRVTSGRTSYPNPSINDQTSPDGAERRHIAYVPDPDFEQYYHRPSTELVDELSQSSETALLLLLRMRSEEISDQEAARQLNVALPIDSEHRKNFINFADTRGVTALHLSVAYGLPRVATLLIQNGARTRAVTQRGSSVCRFARPAQDLTNGDIPLFHRILYSRQWVCAGLPPRIVPDADAQPTTSPDEKQPTYKRARTNETISTLYTVNENTTEEGTASTLQKEQQQQQPPMMNRTSMAEHGLSPLLTDWNFLRQSQAQSYHSSFIEPTSAFDSSESPTTLRHCMGDHNRISTLLTPDSIPRSASWSIDNSSPDLQVRPVPAPAPAPTPIYSQTQIPRIAPIFSNHSFNDQQVPLNGLNIMNNVIYETPTSTSSIWPATYPTDLDFASTALQPHDLMTTTQNTAYAPSSNGVQQHTTTVLQPFTTTSMTASTSHSVPYPIPHPTPQFYTHTHLSQQHLYLTPPEEPGWTMIPSQSNDPNWSDWNSSNHLDWHHANTSNSEVYNATARALAQQHFSGTPELGTGNVEVGGSWDGLYYSDEHLFGRRGMH